VATKRLPYDQLKSKRRRVNDVLRRTVRCPICSDFTITPRRWPEFIQQDGKVYAVQVIKWRARGVRLACPYCGLRFTLDTDTIDEALERSGQRPDLDA
jgi:hypothetical protein